MLTVHTLVRLASSRGMLDGALRGRAVEVMIKLECKTTVAVLKDATCRATAVWAGPLEGRAKPTSCSARES